MIHDNDSSASGYMVEAYRNGAEPNDDFTMMCVKVR